MLRTSDTIHRALLNPGLLGWSLTDIRVKEGRDSRRGAGSSMFSTPRPMDLGVSDTWSWELVATNESSASPKTSLGAIVVDDS
jgi:hypothetical protein